MADETDNSTAKPAAKTAPAAAAPKAARVHPIAAGMASAAQTFVYGPSKTVSAAARSTAMSLFGSLDADHRIRQSAESGERTLWVSAAVVTLLYVSLIAGQLVLGDPLMSAAEEQARERRGQDATGPISVEIVSEPDLNAKTEKWRDGVETAGEVNAGDRIGEIADKVESADRPFAVIGSDGVRAGLIDARAVIDVLVGRTGHHPVGERG